MAIDPRIDDDFEIIGQEDDDDFEVIGYDSPELQKLEAMDDFEAVAKEPEPVKPEPAPDKKLPVAPPEVTRYLGFLGDKARNWLSSTDKKKAAETIRRRVSEGESLEQIVPELEERGWTPEEQFEILDEFIPKPEKVEPVESISVMDAFKSFDKRDLLKLTPKQVAGMSPAEFEYFVKRSGQLSQAEGALAVFNGMLFGLPDAFRKKMGLDAPGAIDPTMKGVGEMLGTLPLYAWANTKLINPLMNYLQGGKLMKGVISVLGNTGVMATEQTLKRLIKDGDIPKLEEYTGYLADIAALEGGLKAAGKLNPFKSKVKQYAEAKGIPEDQVVTDLLKERKGSPLQPTNIVENLEAKIADTKPDKVEQHAPKAKEEKVVDIEGMGGAISDNFYRDTFKALKEGKSSLSGGKDEFMEAAKVNYDKGLIKSEADLKKFRQAWNAKFNKPPEEKPAEKPEPPKKEKKFDIREPPKEEVKPESVEPAGEKLDADKKAEGSEAKETATQPKLKKKRQPAKKKKEQKPKPPIHVDIPPEDLGKSAKEILSKHVQTGKPAWQFKLPNVKSVARVMEQKLYNQYAPLKDLKHGDSALENPRIMAEQVKGFLAKAEGVLKYADYDAATGLANGPAFQDIFLSKKLKQQTGKTKLDRHNLDLYLASKASLERQALGQKNPMPTKAAESFIRQEASNYDALSQELYKFGRNRINNLVKEGITSPEGADKMFEMYKAHVPLYRILPQERTLAEAIREGLTGKAPHQPGILTPGAGNIKVKNPLFKAEGSDLVIASPTESLVKNTIAFEQAIAKNRAMKSIGRGLEQQGYEVKQIKGPKQTTEQMAENLGLSVEEVEGMLEELNEAANFLNPPKVEGKLRWFENGNMYEVSAPKDIIKVVEGLGPKESNLFMRTLKLWKNTFAQGVVLQPATALKLGAMDLIVSTLQTKFPTKGLLEIPDRLLYEYPRMFYNIMKKGDLYKSYVRSGAAQTSLQGLDREMLASMTDTLTNALKSKSQLLKETLKFPLNALRKGSEVLSDIPRLLEYERSMEAALKKGFSRKEAMAQAAFDAFEVSVPYGRKGGSRSLQFVYDTWPFLNTIVNSGVSMAKALDPRNPNFKYVVGSATAYLTIPTVREYLKNRNDPRYQAIPQKDKDRYVYVYNTDDPNEEPRRFRKFWQYGYIFQTLPEHLIEFMIQKDPKALEGLWSAFEYEFSPFTMLSFSEATEDGAFNPEKFLQGARVNLIPERQKQIDAELQQTASTSETAKKLAKWIKISPIYIDHIVNSTGGGLGRDVIRVADEAQYMLGASVDRRPERQAADSIWWGTFFGRGPSARNEYVNKFYRYVDKYERMKNTAKALREDGRGEEADKVMEGYIDVSRMRKAMTPFYVRRQKLLREHPDDLNAVNKRKEVNELYQEMTDMAKLFVENIEDQQKQ